MKITIHRNPTRGGATIGTLAINGVPQCFTLEDAVHEQDGVPVGDWKIAGQTAIPRGTYKVVVDQSARFGRPMPHILDVPGFTGVRIHAGNTAADTEGCVLVGYSEAEAFVGRSREAFASLFWVINAAFQAGEQITITLE
tara:strand:+ start:190 stop:609 length:420 start_codon:yes stop_codon:yes gene_type:complete